MVWFLSNIPASPRLPRHFHQRSGLLAVPDFKNKFFLYDQNYDPLLVIGQEDPQYSWEVPIAPVDYEVELKHPHAAWIDPQLNIYITEYGGGRVTKLVRV